MPVSSTSRYSDAATFVVEDARRGVVQGRGLGYLVSPIRNFRPYQVQTGDRWDTIADDVLGDPTLWWRIADINPELFDPRALRPGVLIRVPLAP
jgi:hypothetical protein